MSISLLLKCQRFFSSSMPFLVLELSIILWLHRGGIVGSSSSSSSSFILGCFHHRWPYSSSSIILHPMLPSSVNNQGKGLGGGWSPRWLSASTTKQAQQEDELFESIDPKNTSSSSSSSSPSSLRHKHIPSLHNSTAAAATASSDILLDGRINNTHSLNLKTLDVLSLSSIRSTLIRQEETIIFGLIERAQFRSNVIVYEKNGFGNLGIPDGAVISDDRARSELERLSFLEYMLLSTVRYTVVLHTFTLLPNLLFSLLIYVSRSSSFFFFLFWREITYRNLFCRRSCTTRYEGIPRPKNTHFSLLTYPRDPCLI